MYAFVLLAATCSHLYAFVLLVQSIKGGTTPTRMKPDNFDAAVKAGDLHKMVAIIRQKEDWSEAGLAIATRKGVLTRENAHLFNLKLLDEEWFCWQERFRWK